VGLQEGTLKRGGRGVHDRKMGGINPQMGEDEEGRRGRDGRIGGGIERG